MEDIEVFFFIIIPVSLLFIFIMTRKPSQPPPDETSPDRQE